jgi:uncharacterized membrane protein (DUF106 family)
VADEPAEAEVIPDGEAEPEGGGAEPRARKLPKARVEPVAPAPAPDARKRPPKPTPRQSAMRFVNTMVLSLLLFWFLSWEFQQAMVAAADAVLYPLIGFGGQYPILTLLLAGILTSTVSTMIAHFLTDFVKQARMAKQNSALQKMQFEAVREGNTRKLEKVREQQKKVQEGNADMMWTPLKIMGYTMLLILIIFSWMGTRFVASLYTAEEAGKAVFAVPWAFRVDFYASSVFPHYILLYSLLAIPFGSILRRLLRYFSFRKRLAASVPREAAKVTT